MGFALVFDYWHQRPLHGECRFVLCTGFVLVVGGFVEVPEHWVVPMHEKDVLPDSEQAYPEQRHSQVPHVAGHLIAAVGTLEADAVLTFEQGEQVGISLDKSLQFLLTIQNGRSCILNLQLLHLPTDY